MEKNKKRRQKQAEGYHGRKKYQKEQKAGVEIKKIKKRRRKHAEGEE